MSERMRVVLSFDTEVWCRGWDRLDADFPWSFQRYVYGDSIENGYALPKTLEILNRNGLKGVFFVEPLFAMRFGRQHLRTIVQLILDAGQEVQLHLHPEWTDESPVPLIADCRRKRQHLCYYSLEEQIILIEHGRQMLQEAGAPAPTVFRAGSYAADGSTLQALRHLGFEADSSLNRCYDISLASLGGDRARATDFDVGGLREFPIAVFRDGRGRLRPAQVGACSFSELRSALEQARQLSWSSFVIVSHNFEMLKPESTAADSVVVRRFESLCSYLAQSQASLETGPFPLSPSLRSSAGASVGMPAVPLTATLARYAGQALRRLN